MGVTAAINTKIERVVEAVDAMIVAAIAYAESPGPGPQGIIRDAARKELRDALADFLQPTLRLVHDAPPTLSGNGSLQE